MLDPSRLSPSAVEEHLFVVSVMMKNLSPITKSTDSKLNPSFACFVEPSSLSRKHASTNLVQQSHLLDTFARSVRPRVFVPLSFIGRLYEDGKSKSKGIFHCDKCGICRKGKRDDYLHCDTCNACLLKENEPHKCIEKLLESDCPICHGFLFTSTESVCFMNCGHPIHRSCYSNYLRTNFTCPICKASAVDPSEFFSEIEGYVDQLVIPPELQSKVAHILCNDCLIKSDVRYHFVYHKVRIFLQDEI